MPADVPAIRRTLSETVTFHRSLPSANQTWLRRPVVPSSKLSKTVPSPPPTGGFSVPPPGVVNADTPGVSAVIDVSAALVTLKKSPAA